MMPVFAHAQEQNPSNLPPGYYIYLGQRPGKVAPKGFTVNGDGSIIWQNSKPGSVDGNSVTSMNPSPQQLNEPAQNAPIPMVKPAIPGEENMESNQYPLIKWKPKPLVEMPGAFMQLTTTFESCAKYKCILFHARHAVNLDIQLLDGNGFKLADFQIETYGFHAVPGTQLLEAQGDIYSFMRTISQADYRKVHDFSVKCTGDY